MNPRNTRKQLTRVLPLVVILLCMAASTALGPAPGYADRDGPGVGAAYEGALDPTNPHTDQLQGQSAPAVGSGLVEQWGPGVVGAPVLLPRGQASEAPVVLPPAPVAPPGGLPGLLPSRPRLWPAGLPGPLLPPLPWSVAAPPVNAPALSAAPGIPAPAVLPRSAPPAARPDAAPAALATSTGPSRPLAVAQAGQASLPAAQGDAARAAATATPTGTARRASLGVPVVVPAAHHDTSPPLREMRPSPRLPGPILEIEEPIGRVPAQPESVPAAPRRDPALDTALPTGRAPAPLLNFDGLSNADNAAQIGITISPPDTNGDVGPNHYVQMVNRVFSVYSKTGTRLLGPLAATTLWQGFGGPCEQPGAHDVVALYDPLADRWLLSRFARGSDTGPFYECVAISQTSDPTGSYYRYSFQFAKWNDYPKLGVWRDAYYLTFNQFTDATAATYVGVGVAALDRTRMLNGELASMVYMDLCPSNTSCGQHRWMLPADLDGATPPPAGVPNYFVELARTTTGTPLSQLRIFEFHADFITPGNSTFTGPTTVSVAPLDADLCAATREQCISQPGTPTQLEALSGRVMFRLPYRNFGTHETLVTNLTVDADGAGRAGIRFVELRKTGTGTWALQQEGTYSPDGDHRWMGSIAIDRAGNVALGYSVSSSSTFPGIRYVGRLATDPLGTLPQGETTLIAGGGSQTGSNRWGDYSAMSVDPVDDCTFWYTQQYYATTSSNGWRTRIGSFRFPSCSVTPTATPTPTPTRTPTATPLPTCTPRPNVSVAVAPGGGGLQVTITAAATANARLLALQFGPASNGLIDVPGGPTGSTGSFTFNPPIETQQVVFSVRRATAGQATTVPLTVVDSCGSWPTFVGGGTSAGF